MSQRPEANGKGCSAPGPGSRTCCNGVTVRFDEKSAEQEWSFLIGAVAFPREVASELPLSPLFTCGQPSQR